MPILERPAGDSNSDQAHRERVVAMFSMIAPIYDRMNSLLSLGRHGVWRARAVRGLGPIEGASAADVCCGTGDFVAPLLRAAGPYSRVLGIDFCAPMLDEAREKYAGETRVRFVQADAAALPAEDHAFNVVTLGWGLRNVPDACATLAEIRRVLQPGGRLAVIDSTRPTGFWGRRALRVFACIAPALGKRHGAEDAYRYLPDTQARFWSGSELERAISQAGFERTRRQDLVLGNAAIVWARRPA